MGKRRNLGLLDTIGSVKELLTVIRNRQMEFLGNVIRADGLENFAMICQIAESRGREIPREENL